MRGAGCRSSLVLRVMRSMGNPCAITAERRGRGGDHRLPVVRESRTTDVSFCTSSPPPPLFLFDLVIQFSTWLLEGAGPGGPGLSLGRRSSTGGALVASVWPCRWSRRSSPRLPSPSHVSYVTLLHLNMPDSHITTFEKGFVFRYKMYVKIGFTDSKR